MNRFLHHRTGLASVTATVVAGLAVWLTLPAMATAAVFNFQAEDLKVLGESEWSGSGWGGYQPLRYQVTNFGPARTLELRFEPFANRQQAPTVSRRIRLEQNATAKITLPIPLVGDDRSGRVVLFSDGRPVEGFRNDLTLINPSPVALHFPALLYLGPETTDLSHYRSALASDAATLSQIYDPSYGRSTGSSTQEAIPAKAVELQLLPNLWLGYSAVDIVAVRERDLLSRMTVEEQRALLDWVRTGGRLLIHGARSVSPISQDLTRVLPAQASLSWKAANVDQWQPIVPLQSGQASGMGWVPVPNEGDPVPELLEAARPFLEELMPDGVPRIEAAGSTVVPSIPRSKEAFAITTLGMGRVAVISADLAKANAGDWNWILKGSDTKGNSWSSRHGVIPGRPTPTFLQMPIPGVKSAPVYTFLVLITLFAIGIGPVNYILLNRRGALGRIVISVPAIAAGTTLLLFCIALVMHGFNTKGRLRSVTVLDPHSNQAVSITHMAVFSGLAPSDGLVFSEQTAVYPVMPPGEDFSGGVVDWTENQHLSDGWLPSRTRTQFLTVNEREERGRLQATPQGNGLRVTNGLTVALKYLVATGPDGKLFAAKNVPAGEVVTLAPLSQELWQEMRTELMDLAPALPDGVNPTAMMYQRSPYGYGNHRNEYDSVNASQGLLERHIGVLTGLMPGESRPPAGEPEPAAEEGSEPSPSPSPPVAARHRLDGPNIFYAVAATQPGLDVGGLEISERDSVHVILGDLLANSR